MRKFIVLFAAIMIVKASLEALYPHPGIIAISDPDNGSDHLYNLAPYIGVEVEFDLDEAIAGKFPVSPEVVKSKVISLFNDVGIVPNPQPKPGEAPLPYLHVLLMADPVEKGFAVFMSVRLLESVQLKRTLLSKDTAIQAITWEKESLSVLAEGQAGPLIIRTLEDLVSNFTKRYKYFHSIKH